MTNPELHRLVWGEIIRNKHFPFVCFGIFGIFWRENIYLWFYFGDILAPNIYLEEI